MWTRFRSSLTLRIFAMTAALLIAVCLISCGAIAYLTPISYSALLESELAQQTDALVDRLSAALPEACDGILAEFERQTGAETCLIDARGRVLHDTLAYAASEVSYAATTIEEGDYIRDMAAETATEEAYAGPAEAAASTDAIEQVTFSNSADVESVRELRFADGTGAELTVRGGLRAVNQSVEAMKRVVPWLLLAVAGLSLLAAFFHARLIARPVTEISRIARRIAALDFSARWQSGRRDEIGALGESLNLLSDNLSGAMAELERANAALRHDIEHEREMERQRLAFFSAASHELKTPVTILKGQLGGMLAQVGVYRDREKYLARALEVSGHMERLIREILTISRIESGGAALKYEVVDLSALLAAQLESVEELIAQRAFKLTANIQPDVQLRGNADLLSNALDNILMNALLYSPEGAAIRIWLSTDTLRVENDGAHIPAEALKAVFTPFYRVEQSRNRSSGGSGLGLYLVKLILELHGAHCAVENTATGVRFTAWLSCDQNEV